MAQPSVQGRFIWQELMTDDTVAAAGFYASIIGWSVHAPEHPNGDYRVFAAGKHQVGGAMSLPDHARDAGARSHWLPYIGADDVDAVVARVEQLGGKVLRAATDVQNIGRYAVVADPQGAAFGVYHPKRAVKAPAQRPQRGEFAWQELATSDFEAAFRFYSDLFGWQTLQRMDMGPAGSYLIFGVNGVRMGGIYKLSAQTPAPFWLSYISVPDVDAAVAQARELGARVVNGPMDVPDEGRIAQLLDSSGVLFAVHSRASAAANSAADAPKPKPKAPPRAKQPSAASPTSTPAAERAKAAPPAPAAGAAAAPAAKKAVKKSARKSAKKAAKPVSSGSAKKPAGKSVPKVTKKAAKKKAAKKPAKKAAKKAGKKAAKKASKRPTRGGAGKSARKSARKVAKKSKRPRRGK